MPEEIQAQQPVEVQVTPEQAFQLKMQEFDKNITAAEAQAAQLRAQRAAHVFDANIRNLQKASQKPANETPE